MTTGRPPARRTALDASFSRLRAELAAEAQREAERLYCREMPAACGQRRPGDGAICTADAGHEPPCEWPEEEDGDGQEDDE